MMVIVSLATHEIRNDSEVLWLLMVTYFNYATGEGVVVPMAFDTPQDRDDSFDLMGKVAELQGGDGYDPNEPPSMFSDN